MMCFRLSVYLLSTLLLGVMQQEAGSSDANIPLPSVFGPQAEPSIKAVVTVYEPAGSLGELLKGLSRRTGVALQAERSIADYRACVVAKEKLLEQVLVRLAATFGFEWRCEVTRDQSPVYVLYQPSGARQSELAEIKQIRDLYQKILSASLQQVPALMQAMQSKDFDEVRSEMIRQGREQLKSLKPMSRQEAMNFLTQYISIQLSDWYQWMAMRVLSQLPPDAWSRLQRGLPVIISSRQSGSPVADAVAEWRNRELKWLHHNYQNLQAEGSISPEDAAREIQAKEEEIRAMDELHMELRMEPETGRVMVANREMRGSKETQLGGSSEDFMKTPDWELANNVDVLMHGFQPPKPPTLPDDPLLSKPLVVPLAEDTSFETGSLIFDRAVTQRKRR